MNIGKWVQKTDVSMTALSDKELCDLHATLLNMLDDLIEICCNNQLNYYFIGGSAIGALRHKGFIPWDNDIDLAMTRIDFMKFYEIITEQYSDKYSILNPSQLDNYGRVLSKLRKRGTTYQTVLETDLIDCGIFIDIYIIENTYSSKLMRLVHGFICSFAGFTLSCRRIYQKKELFLQLCGNKKKQMFIINIKSIYGFLLKGVSIERVAKCVDGCYGMCKNEDSKYISIPSDDLGYYFGNVFKRSDFCRVEKAEFEGRKITLPGNYRSYLKDKYGDYMTIPPSVERKNPLYLNYKNDERR